jgi:hypothetical protein
MDLSQLTPEVGSSKYRMRLYATCRLTFDRYEAYLRWIYDLRISYQTASNTNPTLLSSTEPPAVWCTNRQVCAGIKTKHLDYATDALFDESGFGSGVRKLQSEAQRLSGCQRSE